MKCTIFNTLQYAVYVVLCNWGKAIKRHRLFPPHFRFCLPSADLQR